MAGSPLARGGCPAGRNGLSPSLCVAMLMVTLAGWGLSHVAVAVADYRAVVLSSWDGVAAIGVTFHSRRQSGYEQPIALLGHTEATEQGLEPNKYRPMTPYLGIGLLVTDGSYGWCIPFWLMTVMWSAAYLHSLPSSPSCCPKRWAWIAGIAAVVALTVAMILGLGLVVALIPQLAATVLLSRTLLRGMSAAIRTARSPDFWWPLRDTATIETGQPDGDTQNDVGFDRQPRQRRWAKVITSRVAFAGVAVIPICWYCAMLDFPKRLGPALRLAAADNVISASADRGLVGFRWIIRDGSRGNVRFDLYYARQFAVFDSAGCPEDYWGQIENQLGFGLFIGRSIPGDPNTKLCLPCWFLTLLWLGIYGAVVRGPERLRFRVSDFIYLTALAAVYTALVANGLGMMLVLLLLLATYSLPVLWALWKGAAALAAVARR